MLDKKKPLKVVKVIGIVLLVLGAVVIAFGLKTWKDAGEFKTLDYHSDLNCKAVGGVESSEDITIDPETGMAFISSVARGLDRDKSEPAHGAIFGYDLKSGNPQLVNLTPGIDKKLDGGFFPHGIALYIADDGAGSLFVINHRTNGDFVEIFDYKDGALKHRRSVSGDLMPNPMVSHMRMRTGTPYLRYSFISSMAKGTQNPYTSARVRSSRWMRARMPLNRASSTMAR